LNSQIYKYFICHHNLEKKFPLFNEEFAKYL